MFRGRPPGVGQHIAYVGGAVLLSGPEMAAE